MFVPKFPIKNRALALFRLVKRIESNLLVTWRLSYSKSYLVRVSVVHQLNSVDIIMCSLGFLCTFWWFYAPGSISLHASASLRIFFLIIHKADEAEPTFTFAEHGMAVLVLQSPSWLDEYWTLGLISRKASRDTWMILKAKGSIFDRTQFCRHHILISTHHELSWGILFSENGAIEGWDIMSLNYHSYHEMWKPDIKAPECT